MRLSPLILSLAVRPPGARHAAEARARPCALPPSPPPPATAAIQRRRDDAALVSWGCCNTSPQTGWLTTAEMYCHTLLGSQTFQIKVSTGPCFPRRLCGRVLPSLPCPSFRGLLAALGTPWLVEASPQLTPLSLHVLFLCHLLSPNLHWSLSREDLTVT